MTKHKRAGTGAKPKAAPPPVYGRAPPIDDEAALSAAVLQLRALDPALVDRLLAIAGPPPLRRRPAGFAGLAAIVVSQQVSTASAAAILARLEIAVAPLEATTLLACSPETLRQAGLSGAKIGALRAAAEAIESGRLPLARLGTLPAADAHRALTGIRGLGPWSADVFLLFCLGHADAWPVGDIALQEAARMALDLAARPTAAELERIGERWRPYRAVMARLLWSYYRVAKGRPGMALQG